MVPEPANDRAVSQAIALAVLSGSVAFAVTAAVRSYTVRREILDHPNARSSHTRPTPRGGGAAIIVASTLCIAIATWISLVDLIHAAVVVGGTVALGFIGWIDDTRGVRPRVRFLAQGIVATAAVVGLGGLPAVRLGLGTVDLGIGGYVLAIVGITWSINLFNFMDGIDGLAGSQAMLILGALAALCFARGDVSVGVISAILALASGGFLSWNWPPAKIFMGDVGSGAIGFAVAALAIATENRGSVPIVSVAILGGFFIADATVTLLRRMQRRENLAEAHRGHAYQRLSRAWGSHRSVTLAAAWLTLGLTVLASIGAAHAKALLPSLLVASATLATVLVLVERRVP